MGQVLHKCATTTHAVRAAIQRSKASVSDLAEQYGVNQKTIRKWRSRKGVEDAPMGPKKVGSTVLTAEEEAVCVSLFANIRCCPWMIVFTLCKTASRI